MPASSTQRIAVGIPLTAGCTACVCPSPMELCPLRGPPGAITHSPGDGAFGRCAVFGDVNKAAVTFYLHIFMWTYVFISIPSIFTRANTFHICLILTIAKQHYYFM